MEPYPLNKEKDHKSRAVNKAYMHSYLSLSREGSRGNYSREHALNGSEDYKSLDKSMVPKNLVYHTKHSIELKNEARITVNNKKSKGLNRSEGYHRLNTGEKEFNMTKSDLKDFEAWTPGLIMKYKTLKGISKEANIPPKYPSKDKAMMSKVFASHKQSKEEKNVTEYFK